MFNVSKILNEVDTGFMSNVYRDDNIEIVSTPSWGPQHEVYFSIRKYDGLDDRDNGKFCRVSILEPKYIGAEGEDLILSKEDIDKIIYILNSPNRRELFGNIRNWEYIINHINEEHSYDEDYKWINLPKDLPIPDYYQLLNNERE